MVQNSVENADVEVGQLYSMFWGSICEHVPNCGEYSRPDGEKVEKE